MPAVCRSVQVAVAAASRRRRAGGLRTGSRVGTSWPCSCCSVSPLCFAGPLACSSDVPSPAAARFCTCCSSGFADKVLSWQVVPKPFPFAGQVLQPLPGGLAGGRAALRCRGCCCKAKVQHISGCSGGGERAFLCSVCETDGNSSFTSIPVHAAGCALRSLIKRKASSTSSCFYEKC